MGHLKPSVVRVEPFSMQLSISGSVMQSNLEGWQCLITAVKLEIRDGRTEAQTRPSPQW